MSLTHESCLADWRHRTKYRVLERFHCHSNLSDSGGGQFGFTKQGGILRSDVMAQFLTGSRESIYTCRTHEQKGSSALSLASDRGHLEIVEALVQGGADLNLTLQVSAGLGSGVQWALGVGGCTEQGGRDWSKRLALK